jgi:hypothetical protein
MVKNLKDHKMQTGESISVKEWYDSRPKYNRTLLSEYYCSRLEMIIQARDARNDGMVRKEVVDLIAQMGETDSKTADNHYCWLVSNNKFTELKKGGKVMKAQKTTTKRSQVTVKQQLRWPTPPLITLPQR